MVSHRVYAHSRRPWQVQKGLKIHLKDVSGLISLATRLVCVPTPGAENDLCAIKNVHPRFSRVLERYYLIR